MFTKLDIGVFILAALICTGLFLSTVLGVSADLQKDMVYILITLVGFIVGKQVDSNK